MSSDIGLLCFEDGESAPLSSALVLRVLEPFIKVVKDPRYDEVWQLSFPDGGGADLPPIVVGEDNCDLAMGHACGADLYDCIYEIMRQTHTLFYWSGSDTMITADPSIADHLPADYMEEYGAPALVRSGADILAEIAKT